MGEFILHKKQNENAYSFGLRAPRRVLWTFMDVISLDLFDRRIEFFMLFSFSLVYEGVFLRS